ncbi:hypothetical protein B4U79_06046 [Dinothrombium tinctorium]|uniref:Uncharacterized protein n=1 Tax=Dinothrombium tinctorium TaxID=1965070 RepID=A0A3S3R2V0_9ACAR|nr:hypothetical protein B4U79_02395 [Dinothrombium tinctorium]RWS17626.1 hypothetical protein B4U79_06046 [Dinothrombium tinctorium]
MKRSKREKLVSCIKAVNVEYSKTIFF